MHPELPPAGGETIGERLKRLRLERGFSQRELAAPGVSYAYISRIEAGTRQPSVKALRRLAAKLEVTAGYLETGFDLGPEEARELHLSDLELAIRLGDDKGAAAPLQKLVADAVLAGDRASAGRARVALADLAQQAGEFRDAVDLLELALEGEPFDAAEKVDIYSQLGRAYAAAGQPDRAVELFERCLAEMANGNVAALEARYATLLSYALSDMGQLARAEEVVRGVLERMKDTEDPYMRVRLYWSLARLAHTEGRAAVALTNVRKAIALLRATDDTFHLARAHILAANITLLRSEHNAAACHLDDAERLLGFRPGAQDAFEIKVLRSRIATLREDSETAIALAREALELVGDEAPADRGLALGALGDGLALAHDAAAADEAYSGAVELLEAQGRWRPAANTALGWAKMLRESGREAQAMDVLERAAELGMRAAPADTHAER
jgi:transcriptional regulator with XRE-family HTH domain